MSAPIFRIPKSICSAVPLNFAQSDFANGRFLLHEGLENVTGQRESPVVFHAHAQQSASLRASITSRVETHVQDRRLRNFSLPVRRVVTDEINFVQTRNIYTWQE